MAQEAEALMEAVGMMPRWRGLTTTIGFCGLTIAAIAISAGAVLGTVDEAGLAAAVGLVAFVQLAFLINSWRHTGLGAAAPELHAIRRETLAALARDAVGDNPESGQVEMDEMMGNSPTSPHAAAGDATSAAAEAVTTGIDALDQGELDLHLEPVVELAETRTVYYRADLVLTRDDGTRLEPYLLSLSAERSGFASALDLALFRRVCPVIRHLKARNRRPGVFCPLSPQSFAERDILDELVQFLRANKDAAGGIVIEISQPALAALSPAGMEGLAYLAELGATLSLSGARVEGPDLETLVVLGFRFLDLDIAALAAAHGWDAFTEHGAVYGLARRAEQAGLTVLAANVARSEELERVRPFARLARGSLFSPPRVVRREITEPPVQAAAA
jgi:EAL domain-containing protein (putative c-di-GMP-specific phosphodiesterase class I)